MGCEQVVFVVDDDEFFRKGVARIFASAGFQVHTYDSAEGFLESYRGCDEGCLVLDLRMPEVGGLEVLQRLRQARIDLPVIIYTGNADVPVTVRAMQQGAFALLEKPASSELLIEEVRAAICRSRGRRARLAKVAAARMRLAALSGREREIALCLAEGLSAPEVACRLQISTRTVEAHRARLFHKLEIKSVAALAQIVLLTQLGGE